MRPERQREVERSYRVNEPVLVRWLNAKLGDGDAAREVAENTFESVCRYARNNEIESPKSLIFKTAARLVLDEMNYRNRHARRDVFVNQGADNKRELQRQALAGAVASDERAVNREEAAITLRAIESLPPEIRDAFKLHRFEGLNYQQIADRMNLTRDSVEEIMIEALGSLRELLFPDHASQSRTGKEISRC